MTGVFGLQPSHAQTGILNGAPTPISYAPGLPDQGVAAAPSQAARAVPDPVQTAPAGGAQAGPVTDFGGVQAARGRARFEDDVPHVELSFGDFLDIINPLQHIPIVSTIYRAITGDEIAGPARILGGFLFGGPVGLVAGIVNAVTAEANDGRDLGETALAALFGGEETPITDPVTGFAIARAGPGQLIAEAVPGPLVTAAGSAPKEHGPVQATGQAALDALASDLRGQTQPAEQQADNPLPTAPVIPVMPVSLDAQSSAPPGGVAPGLIGNDPAAASADPRFVGALLGGKAFADRMMNALDQYQTMSKGHGAVPVGRNLDGKF